MTYFCTIGHRCRWLLLVVLLMATPAAQAMDWYAPPQMVQYPAPAVYPYGAHQQIYPYGQSPQMVVQSPPVVMPMPDPRYYYALPTGLVLHPTQPVVMPYPVYYYGTDENGTDDLPAPPPPAAKAAPPGKQGNYAVLAGSFLEENLAQLSERYIQSLGLSSYRRQIKVKDKNFIRVFAGPFVQKSEALAANKNMQARYNMPGVVVPYQP